MLQFHLPPRQSENNCQIETGKSVFSACKACLVTKFVPAHLGRREEILPYCPLKDLWNKTSFGMYLLPLVKEKNNFSPCFCSRGAVASFILSAIYNDCVSSSERASTASYWCVRIYTECCRKDIKGHQTSGGSRGRVRGVRTPHQTRYLFETKILTTIGLHVTV